MKKWLLKFVIVFQLLSMSAEWLDALLITAEEPTIELTEKKTEKETEKSVDDVKEKILPSQLFFNAVTFSQTHHYLEYSTLLPNAYLERVELPPEIV